MLRARSARGEYSSGRSHVRCLRFGISIQVIRLWVIVYIMRMLPRVRNFGRYVIVACCECVCAVRRCVLPIHQVSCFTLLRFVFLQSHFLPLFVRSVFVSMYRFLALGVFLTRFIVDLHAEYFYFVMEFLPFWRFAIRAFLFYFLFGLISMTSVSPLSPVQRLGFTCGGATLSRPIS